MTSCTYELGRNLQNIFPSKTSERTNETSKSSKLINPVHLITFNKFNILNKTRFEEDPNFTYPPLMHPCTNPYLAHIARQTQTQSDPHLTYVHLNYTILLLCILKTWNGKTNLNLLLTSSTFNLKFEIRSLL